MEDILKVLIVDDEYLIRNLIKMKVEWDRIGMQVVGEAATAGQAIKLVEELNPNIIFTDICMPSMNGIEFSRIVLEKYPHIKIIIVTGYDEFEYARSSVKLGAVDFILKPINSEELMQSLYKVKEIITEEMAHEREYDKLKKQLEESLPILKEQFLKELLLKPLTSEYINEKFKYFKIQMNKANSMFQVALAEISDSASNAVKEENKILLCMQCLNSVQAFFESNHYVLAFFDNRRRIVILSNDEKVDLVEGCERLKDMLISKFKRCISFGVSPKRKEVQNIRLCYKEAEYAVNYKVIAGKNQIVSYSDIHVEENKIPYEDGDRMQRLDLFINAGSKKNTFEILDQIFKADSEDSLSIMEKMRLEALDVLYVCQHVVSDQKIDMEYIWDEYVRINDLIFKVDNLPELKEYMKGFTENIINIIQKVNDEKLHTFIGQVKEYLKNNISNPELSLSYVAKEFFISPGHLGRLFKQQTFQTFVEYLTEIRIKKVQKLLLETDLKAYQIGEIAGISDPHYLSILFKKQTGLSLNEFKKCKNI